MRSLSQRHAEGSSAVEFVFVLPILVMLVFGIIQFGIAYNRSQGMHAAAREGARLAAIGAEIDDIEARIGSALDGTTVTASDVTNSGVEIRRYDDTGDPTVKSDGTQLTVGTDVPCNDTPAAHTVRVDVKVTENVTDYSISIPLLPTWGQTFPAQAVFRCEEST